MNFEELISQLVIDTRGAAGSLLAPPTPDSSLGAFLPELTLCATIVLLLLGRLFIPERRPFASLLALVGTGVALYLAAPWRYLAVDVLDAVHPAAVSRMEIFTGMLVYDSFTVYIRAVLLVFSLLFVAFTMLSGIPDREDGPDIYTLFLGATLGMCLMASANHLMMVFMGMEMASVPSYALAGLLKGRRQGSEAALKYSVYGAGAAGVMLYGISLVAGLLNTAHLPTLAARLAERLPDMPNSELMVLALAGLMIMVGLAFKLSAVPFHFWCPDVFEGACAEVNAFLSIASKAAALALLVRVAIGFGAIPPSGFQPGERTLAAAQRAKVSVQDSGARPLALTASHGTGAFSVADEPATVVSASEPAPDPAANASKPSQEQPVPAVAQPAAPQVTTAAMSRLARSREFMGKLIAFFAAITCTFGNLAAYGQTNIKRLLAYSTIAHAGYMMMPVAAVMAMAEIAPRLAEDAVGSLAIYIAVYLFMNLGAFAVVAFLRNAMRTEQIADYSGLIRRCPATVVCFSMILFSLVGLPPLAGFIGKFAVFASLVDGYRVTAAAGHPATYLMAILVVGGINTAISLVYYLRVVKVMTMDPEPENRRPFVFPEISLQGAFLYLVTLPTVMLMLQWSTLHELCLAAARNLLSI